MGEVIEES
jgi:hypothetical protein